MSTEITNTYHLHGHSYMDLNDGHITPEALREFADNNPWLKAYALTGHGQCQAIYPFKAAFKGSSCKLIYGVEAYVLPAKLNATQTDMDAEELKEEEVFDEDDGENDTKTTHMVMLARDYVGMQAIFAMVTASYDNMMGSKNTMKPVMTQELIRQHIGPGSTGYGHVIVLSACMQGILSWEALHNEFIEKAAVKCEKKAARLNLNFAHYTELLDRLNEMEKHLSELKERRQELAALKAKKYTSRNKAVEKLNGTDDYARARAELDAEIAETNAAIEEFPVAKEAESVYSKEVTGVRAEVRKLESKAERYQSIMDEAAAIRETKLTEYELYENTLAAARYYADLFGAKNFFVELQYHGIPQEAICFPMLANVAEELGLDCVITNDCHIIEKTDRNRRTRQILRSLRFNRWAEEMTGDAELYVKTNAEMRETLTQILPAYVVDKAIANNEFVAEQCNVEWPEEEHYPKFIGDGRSAIKTLQDLCNERFKTLTFKSKEERMTYIKRCRYEMEVIEKLGVADYLLIVQDFLAYGRLLGKINLDDPRFLADPFNIELIKQLGKGNVGYSIGPGRGSAVGSLVCYLIGITDADPIKYNLLFERFLNTERVTMPDIDSDFAPEVRGKVLDYVKHKYGEEAVCCICTMGTQGPKNAIRNCARLLGHRKYGNPKALIGLGSDICAAVPKENGIKFKDCIDNLRIQFADNEDAMEILNDAVIVEGTYTQVGMHAAGVIIADNGNVREYVPLMKSKDGQWVSQCDMNYTEAQGLLKMDFLGLRNLAIITNCLRDVQRNFGKNIEMSEIDLDDKAVYANIFAKGMTNSVFQFESPGMKGMLTRFKPESLEDLILLVAAFRPGPLQYLDAIIETKSTGKKPEYVIPEMESVLGVTYGKPIYQEQVMSVFNQFAGFSLGESDIIRRYMSKKKTDKFMAYHDQFINGMVAHGASVEGAEDFWNQLLDFSRYAFNKSHACAYAVVAYYTGYLKYHYPKEYLAAVANHSECEDMEKVVGDIRAFGYQVLNPDVNLSGPIFDTLDGHVRYGLSNIKNVASAAYDIIDERNENGMFKSFEDFVQRTNCKKDVGIALAACGALDSISADMGKTYVQRRIAMLRYFEDKPEEIPTNRDSCLSREAHYLGTIITENPAAGYKAKNMVADCENMVGQFVEIAGAVQDLKIKTTKTNQTMAVFNIVDANFNTIPAVIFSRAYAECGDMLNSGVCKFKGRVTERDDKLQLTVDKVTPASPVVKSIVLTPEKPNYIKPYIPMYEKYRDENGVPLLFVINREPKSFGTPVRVNPRILEDEELSKLLTVTY
jgi:DNA polymerase-3 subunit alpha